MSVKGQVMIEFVAIWDKEDRYRVIDASMWNRLIGPKPEFTREVGAVAYVEYDNNGCSYSPDTWRDKLIWPACFIHDTHYGKTKPLGSDKNARKEADKIFRKNIHILLKLQNVNRISRTVISWLYYRGVRRFGKGAFGL